MSFLPIAERELRVAARKRGTPWIRMLSALVALLIGAGFLFMSAAFGAGTARFGPALFATLTWLALAASLSFGLFFTADSLSEEKREGTLGFLFLTDLRGYDVVTGKLLATSLRGFYAVLALLPILALTLVMGGVTGLQFSKTALALINALFCSLTWGLLASALCRDSQRAMAATLVLLLVFCAGGPLLDSVCGIWFGPGFGPVFSLSSPVYVFWGAGAWGRTGYWHGLLTSDLLAWAGFAGSCWLAPRTWQDRRGTRKIPALFVTSWVRRGAGNKRRRSGLLEQNPVLWLAVRERWQSFLIWILAAALICAFVIINARLPRASWIIWTQIGGLIMLVLYFWTASHACRLFVDARRSGILELLLVTPLPGREIVSGYWRGLLRLFVMPSIVLNCVGFLSSFLGQYASIAFPGVGYGWTVLGQVGMALIGIVSTTANVTAVVWVGMWLGLTSKNISVAILQTILFVQVLPWVGIAIAGNIFVALVLLPSFSRGGSTTMTLSFPLLSAGVTGVLALAKDLAFIAWARGQLFSRFRVHAGLKVNAAPPQWLSSGRPAL
jgi:hypothetical protein